MMKYKDFIGRAEYDGDAKVFFGEVVNCPDVITFQGRTVEEIQTEFEKSVDAYLQIFEGSNFAPKKPLSGKLMLRLSPDLHWRVVLAAKSQKKSLNCFIAEVLEEAVPKVAMGGRIEKCSPPPKTPSKP